MTLLEAIDARHSVRTYEDKPLEPAVRDMLNRHIKTCRAESGLNLQLIENDPSAFTGILAHYGRFRGVRDYIVLAGRGKNLDERIGYYGERLVLEAQRLGLNTCWVALTYTHNADRVILNAGEKLRSVISIGYGTTQGKGHRIKTYDKVASPSKDAVPDWFVRGVEAALLAPTAINQQQFRFQLQDDGSVKARARLGIYAKIDLGIVKYHFEIGAFPHLVTWQ